MIPRKGFQSILFLLGFGLFMFTRRSEIVPTVQAAIVIAPIFILRFIRTLPVKKGILLTLLGFLLSMNFALWGLFDISDTSMMLFFNVIRSSLLAILYFLPYMIDRLLYPKFKENNIISTLIYPISATSIFFLSSLEGPFDGTTAKTIFAYGPLIFQQLNSITGLWGFIFIFSWLSSIINYSWEKKFDWKKIRKIAIVFSSILLIVLLFGIIKTSSLMSPESDTVKIAAIILTPQDGKATSMEDVFDNKIILPFNETITKIESLTQIAVQNNVKIVAFQEFAITINEEDEDKLREEYKRIAKENGIYLSITYAYFANEGKGENKHLLIDNQGEILLDYTKRYLLGFGSFGETSVFKKGPEIIQAVGTPYGKIGVSLCRDMNFQSYARQAGEMNVDIMLNPSYDWPKGTSPGYPQRAIENGFSFIRPTYNGITFAEDYNGRILSQMDSDETKEGIMYANVPTKGVKTIYSVIGDLFGWICFLALLGFIVFAIRIKEK